MHFVIYENECSLLHFPLKLAFQRGLRPVKPTIVVDEFCYFFRSWMSVQEVDKC